MADPLTLGLVVYLDETRAEVARNLCRLASERGMQLVARQRAAELLGSDLAAISDLSDADVLVSIGGDGTVLDAVGVGLEHDLPVLGINVGRVGFLTEAEPDDLEAALDLLASGDWPEAQRMSLEARLGDGAYVSGINDVVIEKVVNQRLVTLEVVIDGDRFLSYRADGLVIAAPTGSTAYSMSAGGPVVSPSVDAMIITPVAPYSLFDTSLVLGPDVNIQVRIEHDRPAGVTIDGRELGVAEPGEIVTIRRGPRPARFVQLSDTTWPQRVKDKLQLHGGLDGASI